ncbi:hypothetical protein MARVELLAND_36 [Bacillus phage vB_BspM_MarvelLand]|nr:hypothetical protein MARVELLAND_36 [Bacillus phage vB_BspM_MarvelLand]
MEYNICYTIYTGGAIMRKGKYRLSKDGVDELMRRLLKKAKELEESEKKKESGVTSDKRYRV